MTVAVVFVRVEGEVGEVVEVCARLGVKAETERRRDGETKWEGRKVEAAEGVRVGPRVTAKPLPEFGPGLREAFGVADADDDLDDDLDDELGEAAGEAPVTGGRALEQRVGVVKPGPRPVVRADDDFGAVVESHYHSAGFAVGSKGRGVLADEDGARDVVVPPQESDMRRPRGRLYEDLAAVIPEVGDTVRVSAFVRDDAERQLLKLGIDKHDGDPRFKWIRGSSGGARPARIRRERV